MEGALALGNLDTLDHLDNQCEGNGRRWTGGGKGDRRMVVVIGVLRVEEDTPPS